MAWCGCSRKGPQCRASSGGGAAGWSVSTSTLYIPWRRRSSKALRPFSRGVSEWVFCAKNWQLDVAVSTLLGHLHCYILALAAERVSRDTEIWLEPPTLANLFDEQREVHGRRRAAD